MVDPKDPIPFPDRDPEPEVADAPELEPAPEPEPMTTAERLRAFEDKLFGSHPRPHGQIERGIGSPFSGLPRSHKDHHAALEALIAAEAEHKKASEAEAAAHARLEDAVKRAAETEEALNG